MDAAPRTLRDWVEPRLRLVGRFFLVGAALGAAGLVVAVAAGQPTRAANRTTFSLGALVFGFALLGWSGSVFVGHSIESMQEYLETGTHWSESDSRRAMAVLGALGFGAMTGSSLATALLAL